VTQDEWLATYCLRWGWRQAEDEIPAEGEREFIMLATKIFTPRADRNHADSGPMESDNDFWRGLGRAIGYRAGELSIAEDDTPDTNFGAKMKGIAFPG
jgi:hypothetical protein